MSQRQGTRHDQQDRFLRERYDQFSQGDVESALSNWTDDFTWEGGNSEELPGGGYRQGRDEALKAVLEAVGAWDEFTLSADEFYEDGDTVVVLGHTDAKVGDQKPPGPGGSHLALPRRRRCAGFRF